MQKKRIFQNVAIIVLAVAIIAMSVGYATYATPTLITGTTTIERTSWDVRFASPTKLSSSTVDDTAITGPTLTNGSTALTFAVNLKLGQKYEFTVDVVNGGTIPAKLTTYTLAGTKGDETILSASTGLSYTSDYLTYKVTYADGKELATNDKLEVGEKETLKVAVSYNQPADLNDLPETNETYVFSLNLNYTQAN